MLLFVGSDDSETGLDGPIEDVARMEALEAKHLLNHLGIRVASRLTLPPPYMFIGCARIKLI